MTLGHGQDHSVLGELPVCEILVPRRHRGSKPSIQSIRHEGFDLMNGHQMLKHQLHIRLLASEFAKSVYNQPMPGDRRRNSDSKRAGFAERYSLGASLRVIDVLEDTSRIVQEQFPRRT